MSGKRVRPSVDRNEQEFETKKKGHPQKLFQYWRNVVSHFPL